MRCADCQFWTWNPGSDGSAWMSCGVNSEVKVDGAWASNYNDGTINSIECGPYFGCVRFMAKKDHDDE